MTGIEEQISAVLRRRLDCEVAGLRPVAGGDINDAYRAETSLGPLFVKTRAGAAAGSFSQEAAGLLWLGQREDGPAVPGVVLVHDEPDVVEGAPRFLALAWIEPGPWTPTAEERFGRALAHLHVGGAPAFGATPVLRPSGWLAQRLDHASLWFGDVELPNDPCPTFAEFFAERRVLPLTRLAVDRGAFDSGDAARFERLAARMPELAGPPEPPSRTHGDLWSGNAMVDQSGRPHLIDPAAHGGHREVDLATLRVFGGPGRRCFDAYHEIHPLAGGHEDRVALWQLGIILLHVALFGRGYAQQAIGLARRYE